MAAASGVRYAARPHAAVEGVGAYRVDDTMVGTRRGIRNAPSVAHEQRDVRSARCEAAARSLLTLPPKTPTTSPSSANPTGARHSARDPEIIGKSVAIDDVPHTIVGIAPAGFTGPEFRRVDVWTPIKMAAAQFDEHADRGAPQAGRHGR